MRLRVDVDGCFVRGEELVECAVEDADDLGAFIVDNRLQLPVPQDWNGESNLACVSADNSEDDKMAMYWPVKLGSAL